jgi:hypothetical protein
VPSRKIHTLSVIYARRNRGWCDHCQATVGTKIGKNGPLCNGPISRIIWHAVHDRDDLYRTGVCVWCGPVRTMSNGSCKNAHELRQYVSSRNSGSHHGLTIAQARAMRAGRQCEICGDVGQAVDHDHKTGEVRGVLCHACNIGLGKFEDNPDLIKLALEYLTRVRGRS